ncbi:MAG TPA: thioredoxin domain-containing protein [Opitutaceae bacterium]|nr:thioredoxin domain-containing protein [Opitutaceae bacterium]
MPNSLAHEKSPYLRQHADNPVDWLPWGEAAFAKARAEQKPIFLSIGYSTCHWCHVMAHESFEDAGLAALLNKSFVPIKVDREERPDVDRVYMAYVQALTGHGGWPLSAWLTPDLKPFYGGTYFPPEDRYGRPGFANVLRALARGWAEEREKLVAEGVRAVETLRAKADQALPQAGEISLGAAAGEAFEGAFRYLEESFDEQHGGFGHAPKFPRGSVLNFLFRCAALQGADSDVGRAAVRMAAVTLEAMARGGLHDHVGGGYHRYSVDACWLVPHFEKMLYDQAQIAVNFIEAYQATGDARHAWAARDIFDYVFRDLAHPEGGFFSAEDADSAVVAGGTEQAEGAFYLWSADELRAVLGGDFGLAAEHFGVREEGNVPPDDDPHGEFSGKNILAQPQPLAATARALGLTPEEANEKLVTVLAWLRAARSNRPRPHLDDKILTAWNGLMISALARGHCVLESGDMSDAARPVSFAKATKTRTVAPYLEAAVRAAEFLRRELFDEKSGMIFRAWREGRGATGGFAEDYAFLVQGLLDLYEASFDVRWLQWAETLQEKMDELFFDPEGGGYFNSRADDANLVLRLREDYDGAEPAPSSVAALNLLRLAAMLQREDFRGRGLRTIEAFRAQWLGAPYALPQMLCALELALQPPPQVVLAGDPRAGDFRALAAVLHERPGPRRVRLCADGGPGQAWLAARVPELAAMRPAAGRAMAYVCENFTCRQPVNDAAALRALLG